MRYDEFVMKMTKPTPRSMDEAYHTAEYCSAIEKPQGSLLKTALIWMLGTVVTCSFLYILPINAETEPKQQKVNYQKTVDTISTKYKRDPVMVANIVTTAVEVSEDKGLDPVLTLAVIATESQFNPKAYNHTSGASGLTQVLTGLHAKLIKSYQGSIFDPFVAIHVGTDLMKTYISWWGGNTKKGISQYGGDSSGAYYNKVMTNYKWIEKSMEQDL